jgi:hypothetical protein
VTLAEMDRSERDPQLRTIADDLVFDHPTPRQMPAALATIGATARNPAE